ncbi:MAG: energy-coupling factor transporter transmembrane component T [Candidatus Limnocylindrales bacterium]
MPPAAVEPTARERMAALHPPAADPYRRFNPLTQVVVAVGGFAAALLAPTLLGPLVGIVVVAMLASLAGAAGPVRRAGAISGLVVAGVVAVVDVLSGHDVAAIAGGPLDAGLRGALAGTSLRLWTSTVDLPALRLDLERRGLPQRVAVGLVGVLGAGPGLAERLDAVTAAQQARGYVRSGGRLGALGRVPARAPILLPALVSTLANLTERSLALESRAIGRPGRRATLWTPADPPAERLLRWAIVVAVAAGVVIRLLGIVR